ncbi:MAG: aminoglycoside phosphotransferase, partial [Reyranella sp.]
EKHRQSNRLSPIALPMMPRLDGRDAEALTLHHFGISGSAIELGGERTQNFRIRTSGTTDFILKVSAPQEDIDVVMLESAALLHIERTAPAIVAPRVATALNGQESIYLGPHDGRHLRLLSYVQGTPLSMVETPSAELRRAIGRAVADLDAALRSFDHPFSHQRDLIWDIKNIGRVKTFFELIDPERRPLVEIMMRRFERLAAPHMTSLPAQTVHSDMNGQNILVAPGRNDRIVGFLDFGDLVHAPRLVDLAGVALLQIGQTGDDLQAIVDVVHAYDGATRLTPLEVRLLPELMIARCIINVAVTESLAACQPANRPYIMKNNPASWARLDWLHTLPVDALPEAINLRSEDRAP